MLKLAFLGTGGAVPSIRRDNTSFLIQTEKKKILIDCPGSIARKVNKIGCHHASINEIFITHIHADHVYGLPSLVHSLSNKEIKARIFGSQATIEFCYKLLDLYGMFRDKIKYKIEFIPVSHLEEIKLSSGIECEAYKISHSPSSLAYRFNFGPKKIKICFSGDSPINHSFFQWNKNIDYLVHDCSAPSRFFINDSFLKSMHTHSLELGYYSHEGKIDCLIPCHIFEDLDFEETELKEEIRKSFKGKLIIPKDFQVINL